MKAPLQGLGQMESTPDRVLPPLNRGSLRLSNPNSNIFSDEFALQPFELTGRHHTTLPDRGEDHDVAPNPSPQISLPSRQSSSRASTITRSPPSISGSIQRNRLSQRSQRSDASNSVSSSFNDHAAQTSPPPRSVTSVSDVGNASMAGGSSRTTSTFGYPRAQSPYQGATGPSHTYGMYPQDIGVMRTPSTVTISTIRRPERSYSGPSGPTQPYGMYPQNTVPEIDQVSIAGNVPPVAGFPGLGQAYQRRLGPEGEDVDDLVGPDGYAEQLPPYTRFPNGVPPQYSSGIGSLRRSGILAPLEDSQETLNSPREVASPANPFGDSAAQLNPAPSVAVPPKEECGGFKERVREKSKRKVCGGVLPCWVLCIISVVVILAVILGGAIGGMIAHKHTSRWTDHLQPEAAHTVTASRAPGAPTATVTTTTPPDAEPLKSTPSNLPPLPTGSFNGTLDNPTTDTSSCLADSAQRSAWDCATGAALSIQISMLGPNTPVISLNYPIFSDPAIYYGAQPPQFTGSASLKLRYDSNKGPVYVFQHQYSKLVIVQERDLLGGLQGSKRSFWRRWFYDDQGPAKVYERDDSQWTSGSTAVPGDRPWFCYWNGTMLEGLIFVKENGSAASLTAVSPSPAVSSESSLSPEGLSKRRASASLVSSPKPIKIEERWNSNSIGTPYCQQMQIHDTGRPVPVYKQGTDHVNIVNLAEQESPNQHQTYLLPSDNFPTGLPPSSTGFPVRRGFENSETTSVGCQCAWMMTR